MNLIDTLQMEHLDKIQWKAGTYACIIHGILL